MSQGSLLERLPFDILTVVSRHLTTKDLLRLKRCSKQYHFLFTKDEVWVPHILFKGGKVNLWRKGVSRQTVALLLSQQPNYKDIKWGGRLKINCDSTGKACFHINGDLSEWLFCGIRGKLKGRFRPPKEDDPPYHFKQVPVSVFELRLHATEGDYGIYDESEHESDPLPSLKGRTFVLVFTGPGELSLRRSDWWEWNKPWSCKAHQQKEKEPERVQLG